MSPDIKLKNLERLCFLQASLGLHPPQAVRTEIPTDQWFLPGVKDVLLVGLDVEAKPCTAEPETELGHVVHCGISILDTRALCAHATAIAASSTDKDQHNAPAPSSPSTGMDSFHFCVGPRSTETNLKYLSRGERFRPGSENMDFPELLVRIKNILGTRSYILMVHGGVTDLQFWKYLNLDQQPAWTIDTATLASSVYPQVFKNIPSLGNLLQLQGIPHSGGDLHIAGYDAHYTLRATISLLVDSVNLAHLQKTTTEKQHNHGLVAVRQALLEISGHQVGPKKGLGVSTHALRPIIRPQKQFPRQFHVAKPTQGLRRSLRIAAQRLLPQPICRRRDNELAGSSRDRVSGLPTENQSQCTGLGRISSARILKPQNPIPYRQDRMSSENTSTGLFSKHVSNGFPFVSNILSGTKALVGTSSTVRKHDLPIQIFPTSDATESTRKYPQGGNNHSVEHNLDFIPFDSSDEDIEDPRFGSDSPKSNPRQRWDASSRLCNHPDKSTMPSAEGIHERGTTGPQPGSSRDNPIILDSIAEHPPATTLDLQPQTRQLLIPTQVLDLRRGSRKRSAQTAGLGPADTVLPGPSPQYRHPALPYRPKSQCVFGTSTLLGGVYGANKKVKLTGMLSTGDRLPLNLFSMPPSSKLEVVEPVHSPDTSPATRTSLALGTGLADEKKRSTENDIVFLEEYDGDPWEYARLESAVIPLPVTEVGADILGQRTEVSVDSQLSAAPMDHETNHIQAHLFNILPACPGPNVKHLNDVPSSDVAKLFGGHRARITTLAKNAMMVRLKTNDQDPEMELRKQTLGRKSKVGASGAEAKHKTLRKLAAQASQLRVLSKLRNDHKRMTRSARALELRASVNATGSGDGDMGPASLFEIAPADPGRSKEPVVLVLQPDTP